MPSPGPLKPRPAPALLDNLKVLTSASTSMQAGCHPTCGRVDAEDDNRLYRMMGISILSLKLEIIIWASSCLFDKSFWQDGSVSPFQGGEGREGVVGR